MKKNIHFNDGIFPIEYIHMDRIFNCRLGGITTMYHPTLPQMAKKPAAT